MAPASGYQEVLAQLGALDAALRPSDGLRWFNRLYLRMTEAVVAAARAGRFEDDPFVERVDCLFFDLYLEALTLGDDGPRAWSGPLEARARRDLSPLQFALAGVNAHVNRDLVVALLQAHAAVGAEPTRHSPRYRDYRVIDRILALAQEEVKGWLLTGAMAELDRLFGGQDDVLRIWSLGRAREAAWVGCEVQWALRALPTLAGQHLTALDRTVGFVGRAMLVPSALSFPTADPL